LGLGIMSVVIAMNSGLRGEMGAGHRRVRAIVAIPVVVGCTLLGTVLGLLFPLPPAAVTREGPAVLFVSHERMPKEGTRAGSTLTATPQSRHEELPAASESLIREPAQSASRPQGQSRSELTQDAAPVVVSQKPDPIEQPSQATSKIGEERHRAKRKNLLSDRMRRERRERPPWSQLPILGPVAGALLP
jgi:hypothetical protein